MTHAVRTLAAALALGVLAACGDDGPGAPAPAGPPYVAALVRLDAESGVEAGGPYRIRVAELSGTLGVDTTVTLARVTDTVIVSVPNATATYVVTLDGLPPKCSSKYGLAETIIVPENTNTTIARFFVTCRPLLRVTATVEGAQRDEEFFWRVAGGGTDRAGVLRPAAAAGGIAVDTLLLEGLAPGEYAMELAGLADNCVPISPGLRAPRLVVPDAGGATLPLRIVCSDPARRPVVTAARASAGQGAVGLVLDLRDGQYDADWYSFDVTDCRGYSVREATPITRRGLLALRGRGDSLRLALAVPDQRGDVARFVGKCAAVRVWDVEGNSTPVTEVPIAANAGTGVDVEAFNAVILNGAELRLNLGLGGGGLAGVFPTVEVRDGILFGGIDGAPDIGIYAIGGYAAPDLVPPLQLGARIRDYDVLASVVYVLDTDGYFTRLRDDDLTR